MKPFWGIIIFFIGIIMFKIAFSILNVEITVGAQIFALTFSSAACFIYYIQHYLITQE